MKDGFIKAAAGTPDVRVADCEFNATEIIRMVHEMEEQGAKVMVIDQRDSHDPYPERKAERQL